MERAKEEGPFVSREKEKKIPELNATLFLKKKLSAKVISLRERESC